LNTKFVTTHFVTFIVCSISLILLFFLRDFLIYRDFSIIWHGSFLISEGYSPFRDFIMPISPVSIYFSGFFIYLFGKSWLTFQLLQVFLNIVFLALIYLLLTRFKTSNPVIMSSLLLVTFFYLMLLSHPWYNNISALMLVAILFMSFMNNKFFLFVGGLLSALLLFTKLDFGLISIACSIIILIFKNNFRLNKKLIAQFSLFLFGIFLSILFIVSLYSADVLIKTFAIYLEIFEDRSSRLLHLTQPKFLFMIFLSCWCIFYSLKYDKQLFLYGLILLAATATSLLGGMEHTHWYYFFIIFPIISICYKEQKLRPHLIFIGPMLIFLIFPALRYSTHVFENILNDSYESEFFNYRNISTKTDIINLGHCSEYLRNVFGPRDFCEIKNIIYENIVLEENYKHPLLNISELNFIGIELGLAPIKYHPLWYKVNQTITPELQNSIELDILQAKYKLVLVQQVPSAYSSNKKRSEMIFALSSNPLYEKLDKIYESPMCMIGNRSIEECGIHIFKKKVSLKN